MTTPFVNLFRQLIHIRTVQEDAVWSRTAGAARGGCRRADAGSARLQRLPVRREQGPGVESRQMSQGRNRQSCLLKRLQDDDWGKTNSDPQ